MKFKLVVTTIVILVTFELSAASPEKISDDSYVRKSWERITEKVIVRYLNRYEEGPLSGLVDTEKKKALKAIYDVMKPEVSWDALGEEVMFIVASECGEEVLDRVTLIPEYDGTIVSKETVSVLREYRACVTKGIVKSLPILTERIIAAGARVHAIVRQYNPDF